MARLRFILEVESADGVAPSRIHRILTEHLMDWPDNRPSPGGNFSLTPYQPDPVDAHGEHGMADGGGASSGYEHIFKRRLAELELDALGPAPLRQPEERPAACACYVGAGAKPYAHEPSCPVHPRYADTQLLEFNGEVQDVSIPRLDDAEQDGEGSDAEAEYARALASVKTSRFAYGAVSRMFELGQSLGRSPFSVYLDIAP